MVGSRTRRVTVYAVVVGLMSVLVWFLLPQVTVDRIPPATLLLRDAIVSYRGANGQFAASLVEVEPYLETVTRVDCVITQEGQNNYEVKMPLGDGKTYYLKVTYMVNDDGEWEDFNVYLIDAERTR